MKGHDYTGLFNGGDDYGIVRYSIGFPNDPYNYTANSPLPYLPGMAFKFFRSGRHSGNIHAMNGVKGWSDPNFFGQAFSNHMKESRAYSIQFLGSLFA